jgi:hypothetical protein
MKKYFKYSATKITQQGQALVLGLLMIFLAAVGLFALFSSAQVTITKQKLNSASDAASYSAALWRARVLNFDSYSNRAILAQEVAVAQAVTLVSWADYFKDFTGNLNQIAQYYPPLAAFSGPTAQAAALSAQATRAAAAAEIAARSAQDIGYKDLLKNSQRLLHLTTNAFALSSLTTEVARANDTNFHAYVLPDGAMFTDMTKRYASVAERQRFKQLVVDSLDGFTGKSRDDQLRLLALPSRCAFAPFVGFNQRFQKLVKRGGTSLSDDLERWEAVDTLSLHNWKRSGGFFGIGGCTNFESLPLGAGAAEAADPELAGAVLTSDFDIDANGAAKSQASTNIQGFGTYSGLAQILDLDYGNLSNQRFPTNEFAVVTRVQDQNIRTADQLNIGVGRLRTSDRMAGAKMASLSAAQVYFRKPSARGPLDLNDMEYASLFGPYWQARLTSPSDAQRILANGTAN